MTLMTVVIKSDENGTVLFIQSSNGLEISDIIYPLFSVANQFARDLNVFASFGRIVCFIEIVSRQIESGISQSAFHIDDVILTSAGSSNISVRGSFVKVILPMDIFSSSISLGRIISSILDILMDTFLVKAMGLERSCSLSKVLILRISVSASLKFRFMTESTKLYEIFKSESSSHLFLSEVPITSNKDDSILSHNLLRSSLSSITSPNTLV